MARSSRVAEQMDAPFIDIELVGQDLNQLVQKIGPSSGMPQPSRVSTSGGRPAQSLLFWLATPRFQQRAAVAPRPVQQDNHRRLGNLLG